MESAQWERDRQVNSDSSNSAKRGRASARKEIKNVNAYVCVGTLEGREKKQAEGKHEEKARGKKITLTSLTVIVSCVQGCN